MTIFTFTYFAINCDWMFSYLSWTFHYGCCIFRVILSQKKGEIILCRSDLGESLRMKYVTSVKHSEIIEVGVVI